MEEDENIKGITEETAQELAKAIESFAVQTPFVTSEIKEFTDKLSHLIVRDLKITHFGAMQDYYMCKFRYLLSKWPLHWYRLLRARKALIKYRNAFHALESFKREFGYEEAE